MVFFSSHQKMEMVLPLSDWLALMGKKVARGNAKEGEVITGAGHGNYVRPQSSSLPLR